MNSLNAECGVRSADFFAMSRRLREAMEDYDLLPTEERLLHRLCLETFDSGILSAPVLPARWASKLRFRDARGLRVDKALKVFATLVSLGIVDHNFTQGFFQLRPDPICWSRVRSYQASAESAGPELPLSAERPLSESLSELSREKALEAAYNTERGAEAVPGPADRQVCPTNKVERDWHGLFSGLQRALQGGSVEEFKKEHPEFFGASAENADVALASLASVVPKAKLAKAGAPEKSAEEALGWLRSVDRLGQLQNPLYGPQWEKICREFPGYVLERLRRTFVHQDAKSRISDPLAYLSRKAREEGRMVR